MWAVDIEEGSLTDHGGRKWEVAVDGASKVIAENINQREAERDQQKQKKKEDRIAADAVKLRETYRRFPAGETSKAIREQAGLSGTRFAPANQKLLDDGEIEDCGIRKNHREEDAYRLCSAIGGNGGTASGQIPPVPAESVVVGLSPGPPHLNRLA